MSGNQCAWIWLFGLINWFIRNNNILSNRRVPNHSSIIELIKTGCILFRVRYSLRRHSLTLPLSFDIVELGLFPFELTKAITLALFWGIFWYCRVASPIFFAKEDVPSDKIHPFDFEAKWCIAPMLRKSLPITKLNLSQFYGNLHYDRLLCENLGTFGRELCHVRTSGWKMIDSIIIELMTFTGCHFGISSLLYPLSTLLYIKT